jgi:hypothetical protein
VRRALRDIACNLGSKLDIALGRSAGRRAIAGQAVRIRSLRCAMKTGDERFFTEFAASLSFRYDSRGWNGWRRIYPTVPV